MEQDLILGRYRPLEVRGTGGFSTVEVAYDTRIQRRVAIKRIPLPEDNPDIAAGLEEARTAALLSNSHIVQILDFESDAYEAYLIMEYVDGMSLAELIDLEGGRLGLDETATVVLAVSEALACAHENQVLHLDIKPDNILVDHNGSVKVTDFGMSRLAGAYGFGSAQGGTVGYMPPEQLLGEEVDERTDIWALAATVYEMLCGTNPFAAKTADKSLKKICSFHIEYPSRLRDDIDTDVDAVLFDALSPDLDMRLDCIDDFQSELLPYLGDIDCGTDILASLVSSEDDATDENSPREHLELWERIGQKGRDAIGRVCTLAAGGLLVYLAALLAGLPFEARLAAAAVVAVVGCITPRLGSMLALVCFSIGFFLHGDLVFGIATLVASFAWWLFFGRLSIADAAVPFAALLCSAVHVFPLFPLLCGFCLPWKRSIAAALFGCLLALLASTCAADTAYFVQPFIVLASTPTTWILLLGWVFAAVLMSALCARASRVLSIIGSFVCSVFMLGFSILAACLSSGGVWGFPSLEQVAGIVVGCVIACAISALGAPYRDNWQFEEE